MKSSGGPGAKRGRSRDLSICIDVPDHKRLRASRVKPITLKRYQKAVEEFEHWAFTHKRSLSVSRVDRSCVDYLHWLCEQGRSVVDARSTVYGYVMLKADSEQPERFLMSQSKTALKGWTTRFPIHSRSAVELRVWDAVAGQCLADGQPFAAAAILLQGDLYLRPHEILNLTKGTVIRPKTSQARSWGVVLAPQETGHPTKTGTYDDCVLLDTPGREDCQVIIRSLFQRAVADSDLIFPTLTARLYGLAIADAAQKLGLGRLRLTPHGLRHSGPSTDSLYKVRDISAIQARGRWQSASSVARYRKPGRMFLTHHMVPDHVWQVADSSRRSVVRYFSN